jgi:hypothetical protein
MSQQLIPVNGGVNPDLQTTTTTPSGRLNVLSPQYITANGLESRPTEWVPDGRPIYRRLPATSETYQVDFLNIVTPPNTAVRAELQEVGYVYVPWGASINGPISAEVVQGGTSSTLLIKAGTIVWKYGKTEVLPTIIDLRVLDVVSGRYIIAYQLVYDDSPIPHLYQVEDFTITGLPLTVTSSTDSVVGWRYVAENAFLNDDKRFWSNEDSYFPTSLQPTTAFLQWESELGQAYSKVTLRLPSGTSYSGTSTLSYVSGGVLSPVSTSNVLTDDSGSYIEFNIASPVLQTGWNVTFSEAKVSIQLVTVSGNLNLLTPQALPSPRSRLVMYPVGTLPEFTTNSDGEKVPAVYASLAEVDISNNYKVFDINDARSIIHRDFVPVADWLTKPFDQDLVNLYEQVSNYSALWMSPTKCMTQEYANLETDLIEVEA